MERSKYFNYTRPTATQLNHTEDSRSRSILRRIDSACQMGIVSGFRVFVNSLDPTLIDIGAGTGYTGGKYASLDIGDDGSGERISTITPGLSGSGITVVGQGLADYTSGVKNYISLIYTETEVDPLTEIFYPFTAHDTVVSEDFTVSSLSETDWNLLTVDQKRNRILVAIVTAQGAGNALNSGNIQQVVQPLGHPTPSAPSNITGVSFSGISQSTLIGSGTLRFEAATKKLFWTSPGDAEGAGASFTSSSTETLYSNDPTYWISVTVIYSALPLGDETDTIAISSLYGKTIPRFSAEDTLHRDMLGSGTPTAKNPHGMTLNDVEGGTFDHADLYHKNGISCDADSTQLECSTNLADDSIEVNNIGGFYNQFLVDGTSYTTLTGYAAGTDGVVPFDVLPVLTSGDYLIYVDSSGEVQRVLIASYVPINAADLVTLWDADIEILDMHNITAGSGTIDYDGAFLTYQSPFDGAPGTPVRVLADSLEMFGSTSYGVYKAYSLNGIDYVIVNVTGNLTVGSSTFTITKNEVDNSDEGILKLAIVTWNQVGELLGNLRDIRQFRTADVKEDLYEEHDSLGRHTKVIPRRLRIHESTAALIVRATNTAGCFWADNEYGIKATAFVNTGIAALAGAGDYGLYAAAGVNTGVYGGAGGAYGVYGIAGSTGVFGSGLDSYGVYGKAPLYGVYGSAGSSGVYGTAAQHAGYFKANGNDAGVTFTGAVGSCANAGAGNNAIGVYGTVENGASGIGVYGKALTGIYGNGLVAGGVGGFFTANNTGVYAVGAATGGAFIAVNTGVHALASTGIYVSGDPIGVYATASTGIWATAVSTGVYASGTQYGVVAKGSNALSVSGDPTAIVGGAPVFLKWVGSYVDPNEASMNDTYAIPVSVYIDKGKGAGVQWYTMCVPIYETQ